MVAYALLVVAWANPQRGTKRSKVTKKAADIMVALDISNSMLATDIAPSRLERARTFALDLVRELRSERIGTIVFAGNAYLQMPLTTDYTAAALFLRSANPDQAPTQGTAIAEAIDLAERTFPQADKTHKVLVVLSDGEDHDSEAISRAADAADNGLLVFTIGVGTPEGAPIPQNYDGIVDFKRDEKGQTVKTQLNEKMLKEVAEAGEGEYFNIANTRGIIEALKNRIDKVEKRELETRAFNEFESYFQWFVLAALAILVAEFMLPYRKSAWEDRDIFKI